jgi:hypothetical protein
MQGHECNESVSSNVEKPGSQISATRQAGPGGTPAGGLSWRLAPLGFLRQSGFPFDLLTALADGELSEQAGDAVNARDVLVSLIPVIRDIGCASLHDRRVSRALNGVRQFKPVDADIVAALSAGGTAELAACLADWNRRLAATRESWAVFDHAYACKVTQSGRALVDLFRGNASLRGALLLSNDAAFPILESHLRAEALSARTERKLRDVLTLYLQRFSAKNETHSHFGPFTPVVMDGTADGILYDTNGRERRSARLSHWAAQALADLVAGLPETQEKYPLRHRPLVFLDGPVLRVFEFSDGYHASRECGYRMKGVHDLTALECEVFGAIDGTATSAKLVAEVCGGQRGGPTAGAVAAALRRLVDIGAVTSRLEIPVGTPDPLAWLIAMVREYGIDLPAALAIGFTRMAALLREIEGAPADQRSPLISELKGVFTQLTGQAPNRGQGEMYADRSVFYEECRSKVREIRVSSDVARFIERELSVFYDLFLAAPRLRLAHERRTLHAWAVRRFGPGSLIPYSDFFVSYLDEQEHIARECSTANAGIAKFIADLDGLIRRSGSLEEPAIELDRSELDHLLDQSPRTIPAVCNPDVMIVARSSSDLCSGKFTAVVGDCHAAYELVTHSPVAPLMQEEHPELAERIWKLYQTLLDPDELLVDLASTPRDKTRVHIPLPGLVLEIHGRAGKRQDDVLRWQDLVVRCETCELLLTTRAGQRLRLITPPARTASVAVDPLAAFAFPRHFGDALPLSAPHLPRISCGRVIMRRESWSVPAEKFRLPGFAEVPIEKNARFFLESNRVRRELGIPDDCFFKTPEEIKPVYLNWNSPLLVRQFQRFIRKSRGPVEISEMLPGADGLWLQLDGHPHTSEIRCAVFSPPRQA